MIKYKEKQTVEREMTSKQCDVCKTEYKDCFEVQEFHHIRFTGGYDSVFGDGETVVCDICQHCLKRLLKPEWIQPCKPAVATNKIYFEGACDASATNQ